jgi:hypothetical protein
MFILLYKRILAEFQCHAPDRKFKGGGQELTENEKLQISNLPCFFVISSISIVSLSIIRILAYYYLFLNS